MLIRNLQVLSAENASFLKLCPRSELTVSFALVSLDFFTKNLHYATSWWSEHCENFEAMLSKLMTGESLVKLSVNAAKMTLGFNAKTKWIDEKYNEDQVSDFYGTFFNA